MKAHAAIFGFLGLLLGSAPGAVIIYSDSSSWQSAVTGVTVFDFEDIAPANSFVLNPSIPGLTVSASLSTYYVVDSGFSGGTDSLDGTDALQGGIGNTAFTTLQFGTAVTAFGSLFGFTDDYTLPHPAGGWTVALFNGATQVGDSFNSSSFTNGFVGFTSVDAPFDRVTFTNTSSAVYSTFDKTSFGTANVPEPSCSAVLLLGGALVTLRRWRR